MLLTQKSELFIGRLFLGDLSSESWTRHISVGVQCTNQNFYQKFRSEEESRDSSLPHKFFLEENLIDRIL